MFEVETKLMAVCRWQIFAHLTLPDDLQEAPPRRLYCLLFAFLRTAASFQKVHFPALLWAVRWERGERGGRLHAHLLLGGLGRSDRGFRFALKNTWENMAGAMSRVNKFDPTLPGVAYLLEAPVAYELGKFATGAESVHCSESCWLVWRQLERHGFRAADGGRHFGACASPFGLAPRSAHLPG